MTYRDLKDLSAPEKVRRDKTFNIARNPRYGEYHCGLAQMICFIIFLIKVCWYFYSPQELILKSNNQKKNFISQLLKKKIENLKCTHLQEITFEVQL